MSRSFKWYLTAGAILAATLNTTSKPALAKNLPESGLEITFRIYNYAHVSAKVLIGAKQETTVIFCEAGLKTAWVDCPLSMAEFERYPDCQQPSGPADLILRILPRSMAQRDPSGDDTLGFALPGQDGAAGRIANLFYHRVEELAQKGQYFEFQILGNVMAHEIGHLLLGSTNHSGTGIMKARWNRMELQPTSLGFLQFTPEQAALMRREVMRRVKQHPDSIQASGPANP